MPLDRERRFVRDLGLSPADAAQLNAERAIADTYEAVIAGKSDPAYPRTAANWMLNDIMGIGRAKGLRADQLPLTTEQIRELVDLVSDKKITARAAKEVLAQMGEHETPAQAAERLNLLSMDDTGAVVEAAKAALEASPEAVADYKSGKKAAIGRLIGETMKRTGGRAKPDDVRAALLGLLEEE